ncbi:hypothetical protein BGZ83_012003 [Gryganskiella cystojenkinii]|nr:hypothetical protein BGZ83_012003 [Gryganskiella cystojenkinii]
MPILRSIPLLLTLRSPTLDLKGVLQLDEQEQGHAVDSDLSVATSQVSLGEYPVELFQLRLKSLQEHLDHHFPSTFIYITSLVTILVILIVFVATVLAVSVKNGGQVWVLGVIAVLILTFVAKMSFLSRMEKAQKSIAELLQTFNDQDMVRYGVLYRLRPRPHSIQTRTIRMVYRINLGLPCWAADLTTIDHIDEYSFHDHPASDPHASEEEILARDNELPSYQPKTEPNTLNDSQHQDVVLGEALPPKYHEVVVDMDGSGSSSVHSASSSPSLAGSSSHQRH